MLKLIKHTTVLVLSLFSLGSVVEVLPLKKADFWAIVHYILYPNKMTLLNKISVLKDVIADDVRRPQHIILRFLWYSVGIPVVFKGDLFSNRVSSYASIFCAILNNLARVIYVISNCHKRKWQSRASLWLHLEDYMEIFEFGKRMNFGVVF